MSEGAPLRQLCRSDNSVIPAKAGIQNTRQRDLYILAGKRRGTLCVGGTNGLERRVHEHRLVEGFTEKYRGTMLVYYGA